MEVRPSDPREETRWGVLTHDYRVVFWKRQRAPAGIPQEQMGWAADENEVVDAQDLHEVLEWADEEARSSRRIYTLYAYVDYVDEHGWVWLAGFDPTSAEDAENFERQHPPDVDPLEDEDVAE